jgi:hypothetical protein
VNYTFKDRCQCFVETWVLCSGERLFVPGVGKIVVELRIVIVRI